MPSKEEIARSPNDFNNIGTSLQFSKAQKYFIAIVFAAAIYFPVFYCLDTLPLSIFDEAHVAVNAIELTWRHFWVTTYNNSPEMWNLKPPLLPWLQRLCMYVVGYNTLAVRLPSAFAALGCCVMFLIFSRKIFTNYLSGIAASLVLVTSQGFIRDHVARNGDYDTLLSFFILSAFLLFYIYFHTSQKKYLYFAGAALLGGLLTKGVAAVIFTPGVVIFLIYEKKIGALLKQKAFWLTALIVLAVITGFYIIRDASTPGYFKKVVEGEWKGIPLTVVQGHSGPWWFYIDYFFNTGFAQYAVVLLAALVSYIFLPRNTSLHKIAVYCLLFILAQGGILSVTTSKLPWYDAPVYTVAALLAGIFIAHIIGYFTDLSSGFTARIKPVVICALLLAFFSWPYMRTMQYILKSQPANWSALNYEAYLKKLRKDKPDTKNFIIGYASNAEQVLFFGQAYNKQYNYKISWKDAWQQFNTGDTIVSCERFTLDTLSRQYNYTLLHKDGDCTAFVLHNKLTK